MEWGVCCTAKAPLDQILAFVAWHRHIGAAHIWVHLDDADTAKAEVINSLAFATAVLCDDAYWATRGSRPKQQERRQSYNFRRIYEQTDLPVLAHVDVDEYLYPNRPIAQILDDWDKVDPFMRVAPVEALHDPTLPNDIFTARQFRRAFARGTSRRQKEAVLGEYVPLLPQNMLSHRVGKSLFRTGVEGLIPRLHAGSMGKHAKPLQVAVNPEILVLHFHAQDRAEWLAALPHRVTHGAYRFNEPLAAYLGDASSDEIDAFYEATQCASPALVAALRDQSLLVEADLQLTDKVAALGV